jgi:signal peptidase I
VEWIARPGGFIPADRLPMQGPMSATQRRGVRSAVWTVSSILTRSVAATVASLAVGMLLWTSVPALFGYRPNLVTSDSMRPGVSAGDVVLTRPIRADRVRVGQVVLVDNPAWGAPYLHRVRSVLDGAVITQGDANPTPDFPAVRPTQVRGLGSILVPRIGRPALVAMQHPELVAVSAGASLIGAIGCSLRRNAHRRERSADRRRGWILTARVRM